MVGDTDACKYMILKFIGVLLRLFQDRRRGRFQQRLKLLAMHSHVNMHIPPGLGHF